MWYTVLVVALVLWLVLGFWWTLIISAIAVYIFWPLIKLLP